MSDPTDLGAPLLDVAAVMARYRLADRRAARRLMDQAGAFRVGRRLYLRAADLLAHEDAPRAASPAPRPPAAPPPRRSDARTLGPRDVRTSGRPEVPMPPAGWWRDEP